MRPIAAPLPQPQREMVSQCLRLGPLEVEDKKLKTAVTQAPKDMIATLDNLGLVPLLVHPPAWAPAKCSK